ncbi:phosphonate C-P lyase system protein PhnG [Aliagarivorans marinus]|uniref:phosphonate C-P lyase system protein PhnG n=1 Tax=Aliagarivorans marinus TaxID=561965 RepID=UPI00040520B5|nr:phosphonate C-P lyase system protein PhnG [Aliagarivorans marinus]
MSQLKSRARWMSVLAKADFAKLQQCWTELELQPDYTVVRAPEIGLAQVRARIGSSGRQFNIGDVTITRAAVRLNNGTLGSSYLQGRNKAHAELAALLDGLLQQPKYQSLLTEQVIEPLEQAKEAVDAARAEQVATSKVDFFTMVRGED